MRATGSAFERLLEEGPRVAISRSVIWLTWAAICPIPLGPGDDSSETAQAFDTSEASSRGPSLSACSMQMSLHLVLAAVKSEQSFPY